MYSVYPGFPSSRFSAMEGQGIQSMWSFVDFTKKKLLTTSYEEMSTAGLSLFYHLSGIPTGLWKNLLWIKFPMCTPMIELKGYEDMSLYRIEIFWWDFKVKVVIKAIYKSSFGCVLQLLRAKVRRSCHLQNWDLLMRVHRKKLRKGFLEDEAMICCSSPASINWANQWLSAFCSNAVIENIYKTKHSMCNPWDWFSGLPSSRFLPRRDNFDFWFWNILFGH